MNCRRNKLKWKGFFQIWNALMDRVLAMVSFKNGLLLMEFMLINMRQMHFLRDLIKIKAILSIFWILFTSLNRSLSKEKRNEENNKYCLIEFLM